MSFLWHYPNFKMNKISEQTTYQRHTNNEYVKSCPTTYVTRKLHMSFREKQTNKHELMITKADQDTGQSELSLLPNAFSHHGRHFSSVF
jgi:3-dehydroquinate dehydratase